MGNLQLSAWIFLAFLSFSMGWESGQQYVYEYTGRTVAGINSLKQQNAVIEINSRVVVQAQDKDTILVKLTDCRIIRNGKYMDDPDIPSPKERSGTPQRREMIDGEEDQIDNIDQLTTPFVINHKKGVVDSIEVGDGEELWIVNLKKSIASKLHLDVTGMRNDGIPAKSDSDEENYAFTIFEDGISGDCSTMMQISRLPTHQVYETDAFNLDSFDDVCQDKNVYEIVKTKDFNRCRNSPIYHSASQPIYTCTLGTANCAEAMQRSSSVKYIGCGESVKKMTIVYAEGYNRFLVKPFGVDTENMESSTITNLSLIIKETIGSRLMDVPSRTRKLNSLAYVFAKFEQGKGSDMYVQPSLTNAPSWRKMSSSDLKKMILESLRIVAEDLKEKPDAESDNLERLDKISRAMSMSDLEELRSLWQKVKNEDDLISSLFIDCAVQTGSNPTILLIKELIESQDIKGQYAISAMAALGYHAKTPTRDLLRQLVDLVKSRAVQSSKSLKQTALLTVADLLSVACESPYLYNKRFPVQLLGDFCDSEDSVLVDDFLPVLIRELKTAQSASDKIVALTAIGSLGIKQIIPVVIPHIEGNGQGDDTAERASAILSLSRVMYTNQQRVHPLLIALADNIGERPEIRMAAISMLFHSNAPMAVWQKIAARTWMEPSQQIASYINNILHSFAVMPPSTSWLHKDLPEKARVAIAIAKPAPFGMPYSCSLMQSSDMKEGISVMMHTPMWRISDEHWPVLLGRRLHYHMGPFASTPLQVFLWNYNMSEMWQNIAKKFTGERSSKTKMSPDEWNINKIWEELKVARRPSDQRAGLLHVNLMGSINRIIDVEELENYVSGLLMKSSRITSQGMQPVDVSMTKYHMLAEYDLRIPTEMGLPLQLRITLPAVVSAQGVIKSDRQGAIKSDISAEVAWKLKSEIRVLLPSNNNYIATGVDCRVELRAPKELTFRYKNGAINVTWTPGSEVADLAYYHVKPYTITRNLYDEEPVVEDSKVAIIEGEESSEVVEIPLATKWGVDVRALASTGAMDRYDTVALMEWFNKWDIKSFSNLGFVPLTVTSREYAIRYKPQGTRAKAVSVVMQWQWVYKDAKDMLRFESGATSPSDFSTQIRSQQQPIAKAFRDISNRIFQRMDGGYSIMIKSGLKVQQKDGSMMGLNSTLGLARNTWWTKDSTDLVIEKFSKTSGGRMNLEYALCATSLRNWNNPPSYGFSKEKLYLTDNTRIGFGSTCDESTIRFKAQVYRNETAARYAQESSFGQQCLRDMSSGMKYGSPDCTEARVLDQTYNVYDLKAETRNVPEYVSRWLNPLRNWFNLKAYPYVTEHRRESNDANKFSWKIMRNPENGDLDWVIVGPTETLVARNIRNASLPIFDINSEYWTFFPQQAGKTWYREILNVTSAGVSESMCYVTQDSVSTFDGPAYNYTLDGCHHVLMTDCWKRWNIAVMARQEGQRKVVTVVSGRDTIVFDSTGKVTVNGVQNVLTKGKIVEITQDGDIKAIVYSVEDGAILELWDIKMKLKVQGSHIMIKAPRRLRGRTCGLCGDYNQEVTAEFKSPQRCALSSGELMAASYKLDSGDGCKARRSMMEKKLMMETESCQSVDRLIQSKLPEVDLDQMTKCSRYETLSFQQISQSSDVSCRSTEPSIRCLPGCKPASMISKPFVFQCSSGDVEEFRATVTVPISCVTA